MIVLGGSGGALAAFTLTKYKKGEGPGGRALQGCGWQLRSGTVAAGEAALEGGCIGDGSEVVSHLREDWYGLQDRGIVVGLVLADGKAQAEVSLPLGGKVSLAHGDRVDVPDRAVGLLDGAQSHDQGVHEFLEVVLEEGQVHEVVLHHVGVGLVVG